MLICRNFILYVFLEILQRYCKLVILGTLETPKNIMSTCRRHLCLPAIKKSTFSPCFSGDIAKVCKLRILGTLGIPGYTNPKRQYKLVENFNFYLHVKNKLHNLLLPWDITF